MAFEVRCPECRAKLRLDDEPAADETIECPKCGSHIDPTAARMGAGGKPTKKDRPSKPGAGKGVAVKDKPAKKEKAAGAEKAAKPDGAPKKKRAKKQKTNKAFLAGVVGVALAVLTAIGVVSYIMLSQAGKMEELLVHVPGDCNLVRGVNSGHIKKYVAYKPEATRLMAGPLKEGWDTIAAGLGLPKDEAEFPDYAVIGKAKVNGQAGTVLVYRPQKPLADPKALGAALGGAEQQVGGQTGYKVSKSGTLNGAVVYAPSNRVIVVVLAGPQQSDLLQKSAAGKAQPDASFWGKIGKTGRKVSGGSAWALIRPDGDLRNYTQDLGKPVASEFKSVTAQLDKTPVFGVWTSFGAKITFGAAFQCDSPEAADALARTMKEHPLGSGDETADIPNSVKTAWSAIGQKDMSEFRSNLRFYSTGDCAYLESRMTHKDKAQQALHSFANPGIGEGGGGFAGGPPGMPMPGGMAPGR